MGRGHTAKTGASSARTRSSRRSPDAPWRPTEVQRNYRLLLDSAKEQPVTVLDSDGEMLVVQKKPKADFEHQLREAVAELARYQAVYAQNRGRSAREWAAQTPYPWLVALDPEEVEEFGRELLAYTLDAARRGTLENLRGNMRAWASTAEIYEDPELLAAMMKPIELADLEEVFPPSEEEAKAADG